MAGLETGNHEPVDLKPLRDNRTCIFLAIVNRWIESSKDGAFPSVDDDGRFVSMISSRRGPTGMRLIIAGLPSIEIGLSLIVQRRFVLRK